MSQLKSYSTRSWYLPLIVLFSALDAFIVVVPTEALLIPAVLTRPKRWVQVAVWVTLGSAIGAVAFAALASVYGEGLVEYFAHGSIHSKTWMATVAFLDKYSSWGLALISLSPLPQHAAVAIMGLAHIKLLKIFAGVFLGRLIKYLFVSWCGIHSPRLLRKLRILPALPEGQPSTESP